MSDSNASLPNEIVQSIAISNAKSIGEQPAILANLALANLITNTNLSQQNAIATQQAMNELQISVTGKVVQMLTTLGPLEARSAVDVLTNNELAQTIADLKATIAAFGNRGDSATDAAS
ncbi:RebB family R body protein [Ahniella affigens]|uniref:RebB family R body protein n=1 Tax=Ahniella affigens TaxID=2021234 RepID=UPI0014731889|nr:RebB family R body protein [Ahniella affigens]